MGLIPPSLPNAKLVSFSHKAVSTVEPKDLSAAIAHGGVFLLPEEMRESAA